MADSSDKSPHDPGPESMAWLGLPSPDLLRSGIGLAFGAMASILGAYILGEYRFNGVNPFAIGLLFGPVLGEIVVSIGRRQTKPVAFAVGLEAVGGLLWAGWIGSNNGIEPIQTGVYIALPLAFVTACIRVVSIRRWLGRQPQSSV